MKEIKMEENQHIKLLREINNIPEIEKLNFINPPDRAEADISLKLKIKPNVNRWKIPKKIHNIGWKYSKLDNPITLYIEFEQ